LFEVCVEFYAQASETISQLSLLCRTDIAIFMSLKSAVNIRNKNKCGRGMTKIHWMV